MSLKLDFIPSCPSCSDKSVNSSITLLIIDSLVWNSSEIFLVVSPSSTLSLIVLTTLLLFLKYSK